MQHTLDGKLMIFRDESVQGFQVYERPPVVTGARVIVTPGNTDGGIALHLPGPGLLCTGDTVAHVGGQLMSGVFNLDRAEMPPSVFPS